MVKGYARKYRVDLLCAIKELRLLGVEITTEYELAVCNTVAQQIEQNRLKKEAKKEIAMNTKPKMHEDDHFFLRNYAELNLDYLKNVAHNANLDDVKNGLVNLADADCITNYSGNMSRVVHPNLKNKTIDQTVLVKDFEQRLHLALQRLPSFGQRTVYRMETHHPVIGDYQTYFSGKFGQVMSISFNLSTSKDDWEDEKVIYVINTLPENSKAKDISRITNFAKEREVLFLKDTHFQINRQEEKNGKLYIYMQETLSPATFAYNYVEISYDCNAPCSDEEPGMFD